MGYRGNNGKYMNRRTNNDLWEDASNTSSDNAKFKFEQITAYTFRLRNKANNLYVSHNGGTTCTRANITSPGTGEIFRYVAY